MKVTLRGEDEGISHMTNITKQDGTGCINVTVEGTYMVNVFDWNQDSSLSKDPVFTFNLVFINGPPLIIIPSPSPTPSEPLLIPSLIHVVCLYLHTLLDNLKQSIAIILKILFYLKGLCPNISSNNVTCTIPCTCIFIAWHTSLVRIDNDKLSYLTNVLFVIIVSVITMNLN